MAQFNAPLISFTGSNATAPYTFTYKINGGANQLLPGNLRARARVNPTSAETEQDRFFQEIVDCAHDRSPAREIAQAFDVVIGVNQCGVPGVGR